MGFSHNKSKGFRLTWWDEFRGQAELLLAQGELRTEQQLRLFRLQFRRPGTEKAEPSALQSKIK